MVFPKVMYDCESLAIKKVECQRIDAFELFCWRLESPLDCKEIQHSYFAQCKELTLWKRSWCWGRLKAKGEGVAEDGASLVAQLVKNLPAIQETWVWSLGWEDPRMRWLDSITDSMDMNLSKLQKTVEDTGDWHAVVHEVTKSQTQLSNWTTSMVTTDDKHITHVIEGAVIRKSWIIWGEVIVLWSWVYVHKF